MGAIKSNCDWNSPPREGPSETRMSERPKVQHTILFSHDLCMMVQEVDAKEARTY